MPTAFMTKFAKMLYMKLDHAKTKLMDSSLTVNHDHL